MEYLLGLCDSLVFSVLNLTISFLGGLIVNKKITRVFILSTFITLAILAAVYAGYINGIFAKETIYVICSEKNNLGIQR